jgi:hypothetical protein
MEIASLQVCLSQPELCRLLVLHLPFGHGHQLLGINKDLARELQTVRRTMQRIFKEVLEARMTYLFEATLTKLMPATMIGSCLSRAEQHRLCGITAYVCRNRVLERKALRRVPYRQHR